MRKSVNSMKVAKAKGSFSQVLKVGDFVYISGQVGLMFNSTIPKSLETQVEIIFTNTKLLLSELNMDLNHITKAVVYLRKDQDINQFDNLYQVYFKHPYPARTIVFVDKLSQENALVEISFDAVDLTVYEAMQACRDEGCSDCDDLDCPQA